MKFSLFAFWILELFCASVSAGCFCKKDTRNVNKGALKARSVEIKQKPSQNEPVSTAKKEAKQVTLQQKIEAHREQFLRVLGEAQHSDIGILKLGKELENLSNEQFKFLDESLFMDLEENKSEREQLNALCRLMFNLSLVLIEIDIKKKPTTELQQVVQDQIKRKQQEAQKPNIETSEREYLKDFERELKILSNFLKEAKDKWQNLA